MKQISIDTSLCHKDGICATVCPTRYIIGGIDDFPKAKSGPMAHCIACGHCMVFCPHNAITVEELSKTSMQPVKRSQLPKAEAADLLCRSRRSIRAFKDTPVSLEVLTQLLETAAYAPTAKNSRLLRYILLHDTKKLHGLGDCMAACFEQDSAENPDTPQLEEGKGLANAWRKGRDRLFRGAPHLALAVAPKSWYWSKEDAAISLTYLELAAYAHGVGACWAGYVTTAAQLFAPVREYLGIADDEILCGGQMLGTPRLYPLHTAPRSAYPLTIY